jgi:glyoxylase-like metal-dependent hydrolase (beta-lactamase superfamily II)
MLLATHTGREVVEMEASRIDWLGGRQFDVDRYLHGATLEETVATGVYCLVTGKRRDSNVYFVQSGGTWVLVDTMWRGRAGLISSAAETLFGAGARPRSIVLTHVHPDHAGSASELARRWDVTVYAHPGELPLPPSGRIIGALAGVERNWMFPPGQPGLSPIDPDAGVPGLPDWQVIPTPGHTPGHLALFREADRALIAGDAVLTVNLNSPGDALSQRHTLGGPPRFATWNWRAATESVSELGPAGAERAGAGPRKTDGRPGACSRAADSGRATQQPRQRWQRGLIRGPQADGAGLQLLRLQPPGQLT